MPAFPGDPSLLGWLTTGLYLLSGVLALLSARRARLNSAGRQAARAAVIFWIGIALLCLLLGVNKQLDLQTRFTLIARSIAEHQGWYADRRPVQAVFVIVVTFVAAGTLIGFIHLTRRTWRSSRLALLGIGMLLIFIVIRVVDIERIDQRLGFTIPAEPARWLLEFGGLCLLTVSALFHARRPRSHLSGTPVRAT